MQSVCCACSCFAVSTNAWLSPPGSWQPPTNTGPGCCELKQAYQGQEKNFLKLGKNLQGCRFLPRKNFFWQTGSLRVHSETALTSVCLGLPRPRRTQPRVGRDRRARTSTIDRSQVKVAITTFLPKTTVFEKTSFLSRHLLCGLY